MENMHVLEYPDALLCANFWPPDVSLSNLCQLKPGCHAQFIMSHRNAKDNLFMANIHLELLMYIILSQQQCPSLCPISFSPFELS